MKIEHHSQLNNDVPPPAEVCRRAAPERQSDVERLQLIAELSPAVTYCCEPYGDFAATFISANIQRQLGYRPEDFLSDPLFWAERIHADDRERVFAGIDELFENGLHSFEYRFRHADGSWRWMHDELRVLRDEQGVPLEMVGTWVDITERKRLEEENRIGRHHLDTLERFAGLGSWEWRPASDTIHWSFETVKICDCEQGGCSFPRLLERVHPDDRERFEAEISVALSEGGLFTVRHRLVTANGEVHHVRHQGEVCFDGAGEPLLSATLTDITESEQVRRELQLKEERLNYLTFYDQLTGLPNCELFLDRAKQALERARRNQESFALVTLDLDRLKRINETFGYRMGDALLQKIASRLEGQLRKTDSVSRASGGQFYLLLDGTNDYARFGQIVEKLLADFRAPMAFQGEKMFISARAGIAIYPDNGDSLEVLRRCADLALDAARSEGSNCYRFYDRAMDRSVQLQLLLENDLRYAVTRDELRVYYQPQRDLESGELVGVEALLRWEHPQHGMVAPDEFIPLAEDGGLIGEIGTWCLRAACRQGRLWLDQKAEETRMAVNLSPFQLHDAEFPQRVTEILRESKFPARLLELEITEGVALHGDPSMHRSLEQLRDLGVTLTIDDFGTGYASLTYLKRIPAGKVKVDRSFVRELNSNQFDRAIVGAILSLSRDLQFEVVAEGIETAEQRQMLLEMGCRIGQGYLLGRPQSGEQITMSLSCGT